jgi:hypothetical protein
MKMAEICISCKKTIANTKGSARFTCPSCGKTLIIRCRHCREVAAKYECPECGFSGPN